MSTLLVLGSLETMLSVEATDKLDPKKKRTPMIPEIIPEKIFGNPSTPSTLVEANPIPRQRGKATKNTTSPAGISDCQFLKKFDFMLKFKSLKKRFARF
ncbi:hypothetical protein N9335_03625 [Crocinitomicaceae bacterium]|nr:hypothetical protein [Crocinitomicaceae bacterium]